MTLLNLIGIIFTIALVTAAVVSYIKIRKTIDDADGLGDINTRGPSGTRETGDTIASLGDDGSKKRRR